MYMGVHAQLRQSQNKDLDYQTHGEEDGCLLFNYYFLTIYYRWYQKLLG